MTWRLLLHPPADGAWNMSLDEALLRSLQQGFAPVTLRFYRWQPPTVSLGYFQAAEDVELDAIRRLGLGLVRRPTGGRAILHDDELTYSIVLPASAIPGGRSVGRSYLTISRCLIAGLEGLGVKALVGRKSPSRTTISPGCFALSTRADLSAAGRKLIGSAQVRRSGFILQHGAIPITIDLAKHKAVFGRAQGQAVIRSAVGLADLLGRRPSWEEISEALVEGFQRVLGVRIEQGELTDREVAEARRLNEERYSRPTFTLTVPGSSPAPPRAPGAPPPARTARR